MEPDKKAYLELHFAVLLFGLTAILGDLIDLSSPILVWWRVLITSISLLFIVKIARMFTQVPKIYIWRFLGIGVIVALHWICFYGSIKLANASIAVLCMATTSFFTSVIEPLFLRKRFIWIDFLFGLLIVPGMFLIVNASPTGFHLGIWIGLLAAALAAAFATLNKKYIHTARPLQITFLEMVSALVFISLLLPWLLNMPEIGAFWPAREDWIYVLILSLLCTTLPYALAVRALHSLSAFASNIVFNMEPVYGVVLAWLILGDHKDLQPAFYLGTAWIIGIVFAYPLARKRLTAYRSKSSLPQG
jgi:drug/metabolite transporter (DMT)-like permease